MYSYCQCNFVTADGAPGGGARHGRANKEQTTWSGHWVLSMMKLTVTQTLSHASCLTPADRAWWRHTLLLTSHTFPSHKRLLSSDQRSGPRPLLGPLHSSDRRFPGANIHSAKPGIWSQNSVPCVRTTDSGAVKFSRFHLLFGHVCADQEMDDCSFQLWASLLTPDGDLQCWILWGAGDCTLTQSWSIPTWPTRLRMKLCLKCNSRSHHYTIPHNCWPRAASLQSLFCHLNEEVEYFDMLWNCKKKVFYHPDQIFDHTVIKLQSWEIVELAFYVKYSHS